MHENHKVKLYPEYGSRKIAPEENCPLALILTLILNQTLTLTGGQFSSGAIFQTPNRQSLIPSVTTKINGSIHSILEKTKFSVKIQ